MWFGGVAAGRRIRDREVASSITGCSAAKCNSGQVVYTHMCLCSPSSINWYRLRLVVKCTTAVLGMLAAIRRTLRLAANRRHSSIVLTCGCRCTAAGPWSDKWLLSLTPLYTCKLSLLLLLFLPFSSTALWSVIFQVRRFQSPSPLHTVMFVVVCWKAVEYLNKLRMERSGKRVEIEVVDEDAAGMSSSVRLFHCEYEQASSNPHRIIDNFIHHITDRRKPKKKQKMLYI